MLTFTKRYFFCFSTKVAYSFSVQEHLTFVFVEVIMFVIVVQFMAFNEFITRLCSLPHQLQYKLSRLTIDLLPFKYGNYFCLFFQSSKINQLIPKIPSYNACSLNDQVNIYLNAEAPLNLWEVFSLAQLCSDL